MKKVLMMALTVLISVAFVTVAFAQAPAGTPEKQTTTTTTTTNPEKKVTTTTTETTKSKAKRHHKGHEYAGEVVSMDTAAKMMTVKGKKGDMTFDVSSAKMKDEAKAGDKVRVKYMEKEGKMVASWVTMGRAKTKTTTTTTTKTTEKKEETTAPTAPAK